MPLRSFTLDLAALRTKVSAKEIHQITAIENGNAPDEVVVMFVHENLADPLAIRVLCGDVDAYPNMIGYFLSFDKGNVPDSYVNAIDEIQNASANLSISGIVTAISQALTRLVVGTQDTTSSPEAHSVIEIDSSSAGSGSLDGQEEDEDMIDYDNDADGTNSEGHYFDFEDDLDGQLNDLPDATKSRIKRISRDLRAVENAGYRFGILSGMTGSSENNLLSVSVRISQLNLPKETLRAWGLEPQMYFVLLIQMSKRYAPYETVIARHKSGAMVSFRIGKCAQYKPNLVDAEAAFLKASRVQPMSSESQHASFSKIIVSNSLNRYMDDFFLQLVRIRNLHNSSWDEANDYILHPDANTTASNKRKHSDLGDDFVINGNQNTPSAPQQAAATAKPPQEVSFPLVAMEFALHYLTNCNKYCQACHGKLPKGFEAIRPCVCSKPLCLFQYIEMGMGISVEHEILSQEKVVDLLLSFLYVALQPQPGGHRAFSGAQASTTPSNFTNSLFRSLPEGLQLRVLNDNGCGIAGRYQSNGTKSATFRLSDNVHLANLVLGQWVAIRTPPVVNLSQPVPVPVAEPTQPGSRRPSLMTSFFQSPPTPVGQALPPMPPSPGSFSSSRYLLHATISWIDHENSTVHLNCGLFGHGKFTWSHAEMLCYTDRFDDVPLERKAEELGCILDTLPPIPVLKEYLQLHPYEALRSIPGVSPSAATVLEWTIATNRSCIFQIDAPESLLWEKFDSGVDGSSVDKQNRSTLMGWTQFCFYQGSPDDELRFQQALAQVMARKPALQYPTILGWHGSGIRNWHSILRTGLDYKVVSNGRSYGNGVYFSRDFRVSHTYSGRDMALYYWPNSMMRVGCAISLNEIINSPEDFTSCNPHYVVQHADWHKCRFLLVQTGGAAERDQPGDSTSQKTPGYFQQDPIHFVLGPTGGHIKIPLSSMPNTSLQQNEGSRRALEDTANSDDDVEEVDERDQSFLRADDGYYEIYGIQQKHKKREKKVADKTTGQGDTVSVPSSGRASPVAMDAVTQFDPRALDYSTLPLMLLPPPSWVTSQGQKTLAREVVRLQALQKATAPRELGWYIDFERLDNLFQWIVQLHSFDLSLPLAQDMVRMGVSSIVCELRFESNFPFVPPFVRVIRPRFLPWAMGGGGHVTGGGAMCMELLTNTGWSPVNQIDAVLLQVRLALCNLEPVPARLANSSGSVHSQGDYGIHEAYDAYLRAARAHNWEVPKEFKALAGLG